MRKYEVIQFEQWDFFLDVNVSPNKDTIWLTQAQMVLLFNISKDNISLHMKNFVAGELPYSVTEDSSTTADELYEQSVCRKNRYTA